MPKVKRGGTFEIYYRDTNPPPLAHEVFATWHGPMHAMFTKEVQISYLQSLTSEYIPSLHVWKITGPVHPYVSAGTYDCESAGFKDKSGFVVASIKLDSIDVE